MAEIDGDLKSFSFGFSVTDKDGNDLFFGENSIYDPSDVEVLTQGRNDEFAKISRYLLGWNHREERFDCFYIVRIYEERLLVMR